VSCFLGVNSLRWIFVTLGMPLYDVTVGKDVELCEPKEAIGRTWLLSMGVSNSLQFVVDTSGSFEEPR